MRLTKLRELLSLIDIRNAESRFGAASVVGLSTKKEIIRTKADLEGVSLTSYKIFPPHSFAYVPDTSRRGDMVSLAYNDTEETFLLSPISIVFEVCETKRLLSEYLFMYFNRPEFDRYARFHSWGSARETFTWEDMCDIEFALPSLPVQQKFVDIYLSLLRNQRSYGRGLDDLKLACFALADRFKHDARKVAVGDLLEEVDERNREGVCTTAHGINIAKQFIPSVASSTDLLKYKVVKRNQFAYSAMQTGRDECIRIALYQGEGVLAVSPAYSVLQKKTEDVLEEYIQMWFSRTESDRLGWFMSDASIRANLDLARFYEIEIPLPSVPQQKALVDIFNVYTSRRNIHERMKALLRDICPILIKGSLEEATA